MQRNSTGARIVRLCAFIAFMRVCSVRLNCSFIRALVGGLRIVSARAWEAHGAAWCGFPCWIRINTWRMQNRNLELHGLNLDLAFRSTT